MERLPHEMMSAPPPGSVNAGTLGDKPVDAKPDSNFGDALVEVCCVLTDRWPGATKEDNEKVGDLGAHYVECLYSMLCRYAPPNLRWNFTCFTDRAKIEGIPCKPIPNGLWQYFSKLYLFSEEAGYPLGSRVLFFDLDTCIVGNWGSLATVPIDKMVLLNDLWANRQPASGVMSWATSWATRQIWNGFAGREGKRPPFSHPQPRLNVNRDIRTDEHWLHHHTMPNDWSAWQDLLPGKFLSYKYDVVRSMRRDGTQGQPLDAAAARAASVVYFHGRPRPHEVVARWNPFWRGLREPPRATVKGDGFHE